MINNVQLLNDPEEAMRQVLEGWQMGMWTALPAIVQSVDLTKMTCVVQPAIQSTVTNKNGNTSWVNLPQLLDVPIVFPGGGGFTITLPIAAGDEVLVVFASRCVDAWWNNGGYKNQAMEARMHDLSDGFAIPGIKSVPNVPSGISSTNAQIRNNTGTTHIEITQAGDINLVSASQVNITAPAIGMTGVVTVTGALSATSITSPAITSGGIPVSTHKHLGVTTGSGTSGGPTT
jgi:hypothetical protein